MRIAQVSPPWLAVPPKGYGGIEWVVSLVSDGLVDRGHDVTLFATGDSETKAKLEFVFDKAPGPSFINSIWHDTLHTLLAYAEPERFDVFHVHTPWAALAAGTVSGRAVVHTLHGSFTPDMRQLYARVADRACFVAISRAQQQHMPELNYGGVVYNGIDLDRYPLREEKEDFVLFIGRAAPDKGLRRAVQTAVEAKVPLVVALKVASPEEEREWDAVRPTLPEGTTVLGELTHDEKADLIGRAKAVLFPIDWEEPFGLVMTESMACGTPVIATPRGSVPEVIADGETGFIVSVENYPMEAAEALQRLDHIDPHACRDRVTRLFSKEAMVDGYEAVFERALST
jgi:glycosyltransferase involved in cell wall biosynthesis